MIDGGRQIANHKSQVTHAISITLNLAEGSAKSTNKTFDYHLEIAIGSTFEVVAGSFLAMDRGYITQEERQMLYADAERLAKSINAFRKILH